MDRNEQIGWLLGDIDCGLNENKKIKATKRLDVVIENLKLVLEDATLEESTSIEYADRMFEIEELIGCINGGAIEESETMGILGSIISAVGGMVGLMGAKTLLNYWIDNGTPVPTKLANIFYDIKQFIQGNPEKRAEVEAEIRGRFPTASAQTVKTMVDRAIKEAPKAKKKGGFAEYERLSKKYKNGFKP